MSAPEKGPGIHIEKRKTLWALAGDEVNSRVLGMMLAGVPLALSVFAYVLTTLFPTKADLITLLPVEMTSGVSAVAKVPAGCKQLAIQNQDNGPVARNMATINFKAPAGARYNLYVKYAQQRGGPQVPRLVSINLNGDEVAKDVLATATDDWCVENGRSDFVRNVWLKEGNNEIVFSRAGVFPHIGEIRFVLAESKPAANE